MQIIYYPVVTRRKVTKFLKAIYNAIPELAYTDVVVTRRKVTKFLKAIYNSPLEK